VYAVDLSDTPLELPTAYLSFRYAVGKINSPWKLHAERTKLALRILGFRYALLNLHGVFKLQISRAKLARSI